MSVLLKIHKSPEGNIVAVCDKNILGKRFDEGGVCLDIKRDFFGGKEASVEEIFSALSDCYTANIAGNEAVAVALDCSLINWQGVKTVSGVKYAMLFRL